MTTADPSPPNDPVLAAAREAVEAGALDRLRTLLDRDPGVVHRRDEGGTLLHHATGMPTLSWPDEAPEVVGLLVEAGADPDAGERAGGLEPGRGRGETPLIHAVSVNNVPVARRLLEVGADPELQGRYGQGIDTALGYALFYIQDPRLRRFEEDAPALLERRGARVLLPFLGALDRPGALADALPGTDSDTRARALLFAALHGRGAAVEACLGAGAEPSRRVPFFHEDYTPLHAAVSRGHASTVALLLEAGADPLVPDGRFDATPLEWARHVGHEAVADPLEGAGGGGGRSSRGDAG
jgi:hypothetical protein